MSNVSTAHTSNHADHVHGHILLFMRMNGQFDHAIHANSSHGPTMRIMRSLRGHARCSGSRQAPSLPSVQRAKRNVHAQASQPSPVRFVQ
jgi:hypothetical protein